MVELARVFTQAEDTSQQLPYTLIGSHGRRQGLMLSSQAAGGEDQQALSNKAPPQALAGGRWCFVNRQPGWGTRLLMNHLLAQARREHTHIEDCANRLQVTH